MKTVTIPTRDYGAEKGKSVAALRAQATKIRGRSVEREVSRAVSEDPSLEAQEVRLALTAERYAQAAEADRLADATEANPVATVKRHENITLSHETRRGVVHEFTASFDEVQRLIPCQECGVEVEIPKEYRGMP